MIIGCAGGGSNLGGLIAPFMREKIKGERDYRIIAVEPSSCPSLTRGKYVYDFNQAAGADILFMTIDGTFNPTLESTGENKVLKVDDGYANKLPEKPVDPVEPAPTGDAALIFAVVAIIRGNGIAFK